MGRVGGVGEESIAAPWPGLGFRVDAIGDGGGIGREDVRERTREGSKKKGPTISPFSFAPWAGCSELPNSNLYAGQITPPQKKRRTNYKTTYGPWIQQYTVKSLIHLIKNHLFLHFLKNKGIPPSPNTKRIPSALFTMIYYLNKRNNNQ